MRVIIMGVGRLGGSLLPLLRGAGVAAEGWSRETPVPPGADAYWITSREEEVPRIAALLPRDAIALHAAGAHGPELLGPHPERGVLHPLMTFPGVQFGLPDLRGVGARIDGTPLALAAARRIAEALGLRPFTLPGDPRRYHAAASLASGHFAAVFLDAARLLTAGGLSASEARALLLPLARASLERVAAGGPDAITGPAARGDAAVLAGHQEALPAELLPLYTSLTERIRVLTGDL